MSALFGPAPQLQTVSGFTVFKISMTLMILGAVWGLLDEHQIVAGRGGQRAMGPAALRPDHPGGAAAQAIARPWCWTRDALGDHRDYYRRSRDCHRVSESASVPRSTSPWPWWPLLPCSLPLGP